MLKIAGRAPAKGGKGGQPWLFGVCWSGPLSTYKVTPGWAFAEISYSEFTETLC